MHPDVHIAYFEPRTLAEVYQRAGLESRAAGVRPGYADIIRYKVLRRLGFRSCHCSERMLP